MYLSVLLIEKLNNNDKNDKQVFLLAASIGLLLGLGLCTRKEMLELIVVLFGFTFLFLARKFTKKTINKALLTTFLIVSFSMVPIFCFVKYTDVPSSHWLDDYTNKISFYWQKIASLTPVSFTEIGQAGVKGTPSIILASSMIEQQISWEKLKRYSKEVYKALNPAYFLLILLALFGYRKAHLNLQGNITFQFICSYCLFVILLRLLMYLNIQSGGAQRYLIMVSIFGCIFAACGVDYLRKFINKYFPKFSVFYILVALFVIVAFRVYRKSDVRSYILPMAEIVKKNPSVNKMVYGLDQDDLSRINFYAGTRYQFKAKELPLKQLKVAGNQSDYYYVSKEPLENLNQKRIQKANLKLLYTGNYDDKEVYLYHAQNQ